MRFGVGLPTCTEGMMYPVPFATPQDVVRVVVESEELGYYEVMGNDHLSTQEYVRKAFKDPPNFYEPLVVYAYCAARTARIRLMTGVIVLPMRDPVLLAKQVSTLDQFSNGRVILGLGLGAYREEFEATNPSHRKVNRSELLDEGIQSLRILFSERRAGFTGTHIRFRDVEMFPKPIQNPLPIFSSGNADGAIRRAGEYCEGWLPAGIGAKGVTDGKRKLEAYARSAGRDPTKLIIALQLVVCIGQTSEDARSRFHESQIYSCLLSLQQSTLKGLDPAQYEEINLVGTPDEICRRIEDLQRAGVNHLAGLHFVGNTVDEMMAQVRLFARTVLPAFPQEEIGG